MKSFKPKKVGLVRFKKPREVIWGMKSKEIRYLLGQLMTNRLSKVTIEHADRTLADKIIREGQMPITGRRSKVRPQECTYARCDLSSAQKDQLKLEGLYL